MTESAVLPPPPDTPFVSPSITTSVVQIDNVSAGLDAGYQQQPQHLPTTGKVSSSNTNGSFANNNYVDAATDSSNAETTKFIDQLYHLYWRVHANLPSSPTTNTIPTWLWSTWAFVASWLTVIQCRLFTSPWSISLDSVPPPAGQLADSTQKSRDEIFIQSLVHAIESNDQSGFVRLLNNDSTIDSGRYQTCLNSPLAQTYRSKPVLHYAVRFQRTELLEILLTHCAEYCTAPSAAQQTQTQTLRQNSSHTTEEIHAYYAALVDDGGNTALHETARFAVVDERMMRLLLAHGCPPHERNMRGYTCAQEALQQNNIRFCLMLCDVWLQAKLKLMQDTIVSAMQVENVANKQRAVVAVMQLLNGLLAVDQLDRAKVEALLVMRRSSENAAAETSDDKLLQLDIDLNRVDAEKPVNILQEALRTGFVAATTTTKSSSSCSDDQQHLLRLLARNVTMGRNATTTTTDDVDSGSGSQRLWQSEKYDDENDGFDAYFSTPSSGGSPKNGKKSKSSLIIEKNDEDSAAAGDIASYFQPPPAALSRSLTDGHQEPNSTNSSWSWLQAVCPKLDSHSAVAQTQIQHGGTTNGDESNGKTGRNKTKQQNSDDKAVAKITCTIRLHSHYFVTAVMLTSGPLRGSYRAQLYAAVEENSEKDNEKSQPQQQLLLCEFPTIYYSGTSASDHSSNSNTNYRIKYLLTTPTKTKHLKLILIPSKSTARSSSSKRQQTSTSALPLDVAVFGIEDHLRKLLFEQLHLPKLQIAQILRSGINSSDTLMQMPRFRLRQLLVKSGWRMPAIARMLDFVDALSGGDACPVSKIEWLVQPPRVGWEMRDIGSQMVVLTIDEQNKWSNITRSVDVELLITSERGGPPMRRVARVDIPRRINAGTAAPSAAETTAAAAPPPRRVAAEFPDISLPYGNYKLMARVKRKPTLVVATSQVLEVKVAYFGGSDGYFGAAPPPTSTITMQAPPPTLMSMHARAAALTYTGRNSYPYFEQQHQAGENKAGCHRFVRLPQQNNKSSESANISSESAEIPSESAGISSESGNFSSESDYKPSESAN